MRTTAAAFSFAALLAAAPVAAADLTVTLNDLRTATGSVRVAVVDAAGYEGKAAPVAAREATPGTGPLRLVFADLPPGRYAVTAMHDENGNGKLDTNLIGMPLEGYGFSNNPQVMRKPTFEEAAFDIGAQTVALDIAIR